MLFAAACESNKAGPAPKAFCAAYVKLDDKLSNTYTKDKVERAKAQLPLFRAVLNATPKPLLNDVKTVVSGYEAVLAGKPLPQATAVYEAASARINRYGSQGCEIYARKGPL